MPHPNTPPPVGAPITVPPRVTPRARPSRRTTRERVLPPVYQHGSRLHSRPGDFVVELDDAIVHGEVLDNVLLLVDLLLGVQEVVLLIPCVLSSVGSLVSSSGFANLLQHFTCFFVGQTNR